MELWKERVIFLDGYIGRFQREKKSKKETEIRPWRMHKYRTLPNGEFLLF